jgi:hypothetical protein
VRVSEIKSFSREIIKMRSFLEEYRSLCKTDTGRLTDVGRALVKHALAEGLTQSRIAQMLEISPAAVSYYA